MQKKVPLSELTFRLMRFREQMNQDCKGWTITAIFSKINQYYFTGTMQDGVLFIPRDDEALFWVRRSYERAVEESFFPLIKPMSTYREPAAVMKNVRGTLHLEKEIIPVAMLQRFLKYFPFEKTESADIQIGKVRAIKSSYELELMIQSGKIHQHVFEDLVPGLLKEGMSEMELFCDLYSTMVHEGHHGVVRWGMFGTESILGHVAFGESSIYPTAMQSPNGNYGMCPAVPINGNRDRKLQKGDLVYIDTGCGYEGYHTDKTMTYMFGHSLPESAIEIHHQCREIQDRVAAMLRPGAIPSVIYNEIISSLNPDFIENFMGFRNRRVKFIGHGIGLTIDEAPVIAKGFDEQISENMVFAVEPKKGISETGMVGIENTFVVTADGGRSITGSHPGLITVY